MSTSNDYQAAHQALRNACFLLIDSGADQPSAYLSLVDPLFRPWLDVMRRTATLLAERTHIATPHISTSSALDSLRHTAGLQLEMAIADCNPVGAARACLFLRGVDLAIEDLQQDVGAPSLN